MSRFKNIKSFLLTGVSLLTFVVEPAQAWPDFNPFNKIKEAVTTATQKVGQAVTTAIQKVGQAVTTVVQKVAPPPDLIKKVHEALDSAKVAKDLLGRIDYKAKQISGSVVDQEAINQLNAIVANFNTVNKAAQDILNGPCGPHAFVQKIPPWFQQQMNNLGTFKDLAEDGVKITGKILGSAPDVAALVGILASIGKKVAGNMNTDKNRKILMDAANTFSSSMSKLEKIPGAINNAVDVVIKAGVLITKGTTCASSLATDIKEGVEAIATGASGVVACVSTGVGCAEALATLKSVAVGSVSSVISGASCALTVGGRRKMARTILPILLNFWHRLQILRQKSIPLEKPL